MRLFLLSLTLLVTGATLSILALVTTDEPTITLFGPTCTSIGLLLAVITNVRKDRS